MIRFLFRLIVLFLVVCGIGAVACTLWFVGQGISAKSAPGALEMAVAPRLRSMAIPRAARDQRSPVPASAAALNEGMEHFADHCALCHANDGSGDTRMGRNLYPRVPDMRLAATQDLTDGELFYIIENGVKLTGMPAWGGDPEHGAEATWNLVQFIRHIPKLTPAELSKMKELNPKAPDEEAESKDSHKHKHGDEK
ncbi:MAG TPA: c-type cytochrome [Vicinamibacterales bacterium]|jgi:mono/diheme cytochrome c family protein|nr:c-type cytochrome [Vicinamibacterales bacterium]